VHNFEREGRDDDLKLIDASNFSYFPNLWELSFLNLTASSSKNSSHHHVSPEDCAEKGLYGFDAFSGTKDNTSYPATYTEAANRPVYTAWNILRTDMGNPNFGSVCAVFSTEYVRNMTVVAAVDTGIYEMACNDSFSKSHSHHGNCSQGVSNVGSLDHFDHLLLENHFFWFGNLNVTMARIFGDTPAIRLAAVNKGMTIEYLEPDIAGSPSYPDSIKMLIASFADLFGTAKGQQLQAWCVSQGWPLLWAIGFAGGDSHQESSMPVAMDRITDPLVQQAHQHQQQEKAQVQAPHRAGLNISTALIQQAASPFRQSWSAINQSRPPLNDSSTWAALWSKFVAEIPPELRVQPLFADDCQDTARCIGRNAPGDCVCS
jgi:hypothetical protein